MSDALFHDLVVRNAVRAILVSKGIRAEADLEDAVGQVVLACVEHVRGTGVPPEQLSDAIALARTIAHAHGVDEIRKRVRRGRSNLGPTGEADEHAREAHPSLDPVDQERMLAAIRGELEDEQIEVLADVGAGVQQSEIAAERGASKAAMRKRVQASREKALGALGARGYWLAGGIGALLTGAIVLIVAPWRVVPDPGRSDAETVSSPPPVRERAAEERRVAAGACEERRWDACERALDRAARQDPAGDREAEVVALREAIAAGRREAGADGGK